MLDIRQSRVGARGAESSPLASQLQQAWLHSQIHSKVQKRSLFSQVRDVSAQNRAYIQQYSYLPSLDLRGIVDHHDANDASIILNGAIDLEESPYFHKSRPGRAPEFLQRPVLPQLHSFSRKTDLPRRSRSASLIEATTTSSSSSEISYKRSASLSPSSSFQNASAASADAVEPADNSSNEPFIRFLDNMTFTDNTSEEKGCVMHEDSAYQAIEKEISALIAPDRSHCSFANEPELIIDYDSSWTKTGEVPTEDGLTERLLHAYTSNLSKHLMDVSMVSENVDSSLWVDERDACTDHSDASYNSPFYTLSPRPHLSNPFYQTLQFAGATLETELPVSTPSVDLAALLLRCALVVSQEDVRSATKLIGELRQHSSATGNAVQRMAYYYMEALVAKMSGTGAQLYKALINNRLPAAMMFKAHRLFVDYCPYLKVGHFLAMKIVLDAFEGAARVHVVDYGLTYGSQWPCLIQQLSQRPGGPPHLRITGIDVQQGKKPSGRILEAGTRLAAFAKLWGVPFEFHALADQWESITPAQLSLRSDEVLAVHCQNSLRNLLDESIMAASPRKIVLDRIRSMKPKVFVMAVINGNHNAPFFMTRFRESIKYYSSMFDAMDVSMSSDDPDRVLLERNCYGREILNIVACEGRDRVERAEPYRQWQSRTQRAGFSQVPLKPVIMSKIQAMMASYHKDYGVGEDGSWFLMGWKNQIVRAVTVWEPTQGS